MALIAIELWCTAVSKSGNKWLVGSDSTLVTLNIDDLNNDGLIDGTEWDAATAGGANGQDKGSANALYDGSSGNSGFLYSNVEYSSGDNVTVVIKSLNNKFLADPDDLGDVVCFCRGTMIRTDRAQVPIEDLRVGDMIKTRDNGLQPIRWIGSRMVNGTGHMAPIRFKENALENNRELRLSPQHRVLLRDWRAELMFGAREVLVPAKSLINDTTIQRIETGAVEYFHILLDAHEIIFAEGMPAESLFLSSGSIGVLGEPTQREVFELFPSLAKEGFKGLKSAARPLLRYFEARALTAL